MYFLLLSGKVGLICSICVVPFFLVRFQKIFVIYSIKDNKQKTYYCKKRSERVCWD